MKYSVFTCAAALLAISSANAATSFTDRSAFIAQTSPQVSVDFNGVPAGSSFEGQELTVGNMTLRGGVYPLLPDGGFNVIAPGGLCTDTDLDFLTLDATQFACSFVDPQLDLRIDFNAPVTAWGADFRDIADTNRKTKLSFYDAEDGLITEYLAQGLEDSEKSFIGLDLMDNAATHLIFSLVLDPDQDYTLDFFGMDNVLFSTARGGVTPNPVPVPPALLLFGSAGAAFAGMRSARRLKR
ncbi:MAG: hypothetical protein AAF607_04915 [Pseudomonadota bacterium]